MRLMITMRLALLAALLALSGVAAVFGQAVLVPYVPNLSQTDAIQVIPRGSPSAVSYYATPGQIGGVEGYSYQIPLTAFAITVANWSGLNAAAPSGPPRSV